MKTEQISKVILHKIMNNQNEKASLEEAMDEKSGKPKNTAKKPIPSGAMSIEVLKNPHNLLRIWVKIKGIHVRVEYLSEAAKALQTDLQDLKLTYKPLQAETEKKKKSVINTGKKVKTSLDFLDHIMEVKKIVKATEDFLGEAMDEKSGKPKNTPKKPIPSGAMRIKVLENPHNLLQNWVEIQRKHVRLAHLRQAKKAVENEQQDLERQAEAEKEENKKLIVEIRGQGGTIIQQKL